MKVRFSTRTWVCVLALAATPALCQAQNTASKQAETAGVRTCLRAINQVEAWLARGQAGSAASFWSADNPDKSLFSSVIALENKTGASVTSLNAFPLPNGQCVVEYTQSGYVPASCRDYLQAQGGSLRPVRDLDSKTTLFAGQGVQVLLTHAGSGCMWTRKEILANPGAAEEAKGQVAPKPAR